MKQVLSQLSYASRKSAANFSQHRRRGEAIHPRFPGLTLPALEWRRRWDSNPRALSGNTISSRARYDHFDTSPSRALLPATALSTPFCIVAELPKNFKAFPFIFSHTFSANAPREQGKRLHKTCPHILFRMCAFISHMHLHRKKRKRCFFLRPPDSGSAENHAFSLFLFDPCAFCQGKEHGKPAVKFICWANGIF